MDTIFKALSAREHKTYARLKARIEHAEQSAVLPATPLPEAKPAPRRVHRTQHRHGSRDGESVPDPESLAFCVEEAARLIGVSRATLYVLISAGDLRTIKIRKRRLVPREALLKLLTVGAA
jgi:excisionase family DNA binding protein